MIRISITLLLKFLVGVLCSICSVSAQSSVVVTVHPQTVYIEKSDTQQYVNFDFLVRNTSEQKLTLTKISVAVLDVHNKLIHSRFLDGNGTAPSIQTIADRDFDALASKLIFNPFDTFENRLAIFKMRFDFDFVNSKEQTVHVATEVFPKQYTQKIPYVFPLKGKVLIYDAHDSYSHHRRFNYEFAPIKQLGIKSNFMRYAYDFVLLDANDATCKGNENVAEDYFGFKKPIFAVAAGKVIYVSNEHKDDKTFDVPKLATNPLELYGNCIAIQHANGAISIYGHLLENSLNVTVGDTVKSGQQIASIGVSGSSFFPHLHFEMRTAINHEAEGLPSSFSNVFSNGILLKSGFAGTGSVIETH